MTITHFEAVMTGISGLFLTLSVIAAGLRWIYKQGVSSTRLVTAIESNTRATGDLSDSFGKFTEKTDGTLTDHEHRLTRAEDRIENMEKRGAG
jgi:hypothetical protein